MATQQKHGTRLITAITPTVAALLGIDPPSLSEREPLEEVIRAGSAELAGKAVQRSLIFCPDAIGAWLAEKYRDMFREVVERAPLRLRLRSVLPPKTPVCWASIFTGALPRVHGIQPVSPRPTFHSDSLFDALVRARKQTAIVAVTDSSMDRVFRGRDLDYFAERYDPQVTDRVVELLEAGDHEVIVAYVQEYDDLMHQTTPESAVALRAVEHHVESFRAIADAYSKYWRGADRGLMWLTDHGTHVNPTTGRGTHGDDIPEDMMVEHYFGFQRA